MASRHESPTPVPSRRHQLLPPPEIPHRYRIKVKVVLHKDRKQDGDTQSLNFHPGTLTDRGALSDRAGPLKAILPPTGGPGTISGQIDSLGELACINRPPLLKVLPDRPRTAPPNGMRLRPEDTIKKDPLTILKIKPPGREKKYVDNNNWPTDSPAAGVYDIRNTSAKMVMYNNKKSSSNNRLRGYSATTAPREPSPTRHLPNIVHKKNPERHTECATTKPPPQTSHDSDSKLPGAWLNQAVRQQPSPQQHNEQQPIEANPRVDHSRHTYCHMDADLLRYLHLQGPVRQKQVLARVPGDDGSTTEYKFLQDPQLTPAERKYLSSVASVYSTSKMKSLKQNQYRNLLRKQLRLGFASAAEYEKYMRYLEGPRQTDTGTRLEQQKQAAKSKHKDEPLLAKRRAAQDSKGLKHEHSGPSPYTEDQARGVPAEGELPAPTLPRRARKSGKRKDPDAPRPHTAPGGGGSYPRGSRHGWTHEELEGRRHRKSEFAFLQTVTAEAERTDDQDDTYTSHQGGPLSVDSVSSYGSKDSIVPRPPQTPREGHGRPKSRLGRKKPKQEDIEDEDNIPEDGDNNRDNSLIVVVDNDAHVNESQSQEVKEDKNTVNDISKGTFSTQTGDGEEPEAQHTEVSTSISDFKAYLESQKTSAEMVDTGTSMEDERAARRAKRRKRREERARQAEEARKLNMAADVKEALDQKSEGDLRVSELDTSLDMEKPKESQQSQDPKKEEVVQNESTQVDEQLKQASSPPDDMEKSKESQQSQDPKKEELVQNESAQVDEQFKQASSPPEAESEPAGQPEEPIVKVTYRAPQPEPEKLGFIEQTLTTEYSKESQEKPDEVTGKHVEEPPAQQSETLLTKEKTIPKEVQEEIKPAAEAKDSSTPKEETPEPTMDQLNNETTITLPNASLLSLCDDTMQGSPRPIDSSRPLSPSIDMIIPENTTLEATEEGEDTMDVRLESPDPIGVTDADNISSPPVPPSPEPMPLDEQIEKEAKDEAREVNEEVKNVKEEIQEFQEEVVEGAKEAEETPKANTQKSESSKEEGSTKEVKSKESQKEVDNISSPPVPPSPEPTPLDEQVEKEAKDEVREVNEEVKNLKEEVQEFKEKVKEGTMEAEETPKANTPKSESTIEEGSINEVKPEESQKEGEVPIGEHEGAIDPKATSEKVGDAANKSLTEVETELLTLEQQVNKPSVHAESDKTSKTESQENEDEAITQKASEVVQDVLKKVESQIMSENEEMRKSQDQLQKNTANEEKANSQFEGASVLETAVDVSSQLMGLEDSNQEATTKDVSESRTVQEAKEEAQETPKANEEESESSKDKAIKEVKPEVKTQGEGEIPIDEVRDIMSPEPTSQKADDAVQESLSEVETELLLTEQHLNEPIVSAESNETSKTESHEHKNEAGQPQEGQKEEESNKNDTPESALIHQDDGSLHQFNLDPLDNNEEQDAGATETEQLQEGQKEGEATKKNTPESTLIQDDGGSLHQISMDPIDNDEEQEEAKKDIEKPHKVLKEDKSNKEHTPESGVIQEDNHSLHQFSINPLDGDKEQQTEKKQTEDPQDAQKEVEAAKKYMSDSMQVQKDDSSLQQFSVDPINADKEEEIEKDEREESQEEQKEAKTAEKNRLESALIQGDNGSLHQFSMDPFDSGEGQEVVKKETKKSQEGQKDEEATKKNTPELVVTQEEDDSLHQLSMDPLNKDEEQEVVIKEPEKSQEGQKEEEATEKNTPESVAIQEDNDSLHQLSMDPLDKDEEQEVAKKEAGEPRDVEKQEESGKKNTSESALIQEDNGSLHQLSMDPLNSNTEQEEAKKETEQPQVGQKEEPSSKNNTSESAITQEDDGSLHQFSIDPLDSEEEQDVGKKDTEQLQEVQKEEEAIKKNTPESAEIQEENDSLHQFSMDPLDSDKEQDVAGKEAGESQEVEKQEESGRKNTSESALIQEDKGSLHQFNMNPLNRDKEQDIAKQEAKKSQEVQNEEESNKKNTPESALIQNDNGSLNQLSIDPFDNDEEQGEGKKTTNELVLDTTKLMEPEETVGHRSSIKVSFPDGSIIQQAQTQKDSASILDTTLANGHEETLAKEEEKVHVPIIKGAVPPQSPRGSDLKSKMESKLNTSQVQLPTQTNGIPRILTESINGHDHSESV